MGHSDNRLIQRDIGSDLVTRLVLLLPQPNLNVKRF